MDEKKNNTPKTEDAGKAEVETTLPETEKAEKQEAEATPPKTGGGDEANAVAAAEPANDAQLLQKLESIEALLTKQVKQQQRNGVYRLLSVLLMLCLVVVIGWGLMSVVGTLQDVTSDLPTLINHMNDLVKQLNDVEFETLTNNLNDTMTDLDKGISSINFEELNASIEHLSEVTESLANVTRFFGG